MSFFQPARERLPEHSAEILGSDTRLCGDTGLSFIQVTSWFINARKRGWKPLIYQNTDHAELISAATLRGPLEAGLEVEPGTCSQSGALACSGHNTISNSDIQVTIFHEVEHSQSKARDAIEEMQDVEINDDTGDRDLARKPTVCVSPRCLDLIQQQTVGSHAQPMSTTSTERLFASHVMSPHRLMMHQHADVVIGHDGQQGPQQIETNEKHPEPTLFSHDFGLMASPCTSPQHDYSLCTAAAQSPHTLHTPPIGIHFGAHNIFSRSFLDDTAPVPVALETVLDEIFEFMR